MIPQIRICTTSFLVFVSALATGQVLTKSNSGLTTPEYVQVLAHASGSIPLPYLTSLSAQDVNGDGKPDLLATGLDPLSNPVAITTTLLRNAGSENFTQVFGNNSSYCQPVPSYPVAANTVAPFCTLADLNRDGLPDKIFAGEYPSTSNPGEVDYPYIKVEYGTGRGTWAAPVKYAMGGRGLYITSVATGDFNGDGRTDIAVLELSQTPTGYPAAVYGNVYVLWGDAGGGFTLSPHGYPTGLNNYFGDPPDPTQFYPNMQITAVDLNGDGISDLLATSGPFGGYSIMIGGHGGFTTQPLSDLGSPSNALLAVDLNKDGFSDLVLQESTQIDPQGLLHVLSGGGQNSALFGWFSKDQTLPLNEYEANVTGIVAGDFNRDGRLDLAVRTGLNLNIYLQNADGTFTNPRQYALSSSGFLVMGDFNGDGKLDLAVGGNPLTIFYGDGYGSFTGSTVTSSFFPGALFGSGDVATADFNKDGKADVATTMEGTCNRDVCSSLVNVFMGSGEGWFLPEKNYAVPAPASIIATGDLNGDGFQDIVTLYTYGNDPAGIPDTGVLLGKAGGAFAAGKGYTLGVSGVDLILRDVNNDGKLDMITDAGVALGKGDGTFGDLISFPYTPVEGCGTCQSIAVGDFNHDGKLDVLYSQNGIHVLLGDGTGHFIEKATYTPVCGAYCGSPIIAVADLNGDGKLDFVAGFAASMGGGIAIFLGNGDGTFKAGETDAIAPNGAAIYGTQVVAVTIHDLNGDGVPDVIVSTTAGMPVFLGKGGGHFTAPLVFASPAGNFGSSAFAIADYDSKGTPDIAVPVFNGVARMLNSGYSTWPKVSSLPAPTPYRFQTP